MFTLLQIFASSSPGMGKFGVPFGNFWRLKKFAGASRPEFGGITSVIATVSSAR